MTFLVAALALAQSGEGMDARVSYVTPGATLAKVAQDLSDQTGVKILPGPGMEREILQIRVSDVKLGDLLSRIAQVKQGKLQPKGEQWIIEFDLTPFVEARRASERAAIANIAGGRKRLGAASKRRTVDYGDGPEVIEPGAMDMISNEVIRKLTDQQIAEASRSGRQFATSPVGDQLPVPAIDARLIELARQEIKEFSRTAPASGLDDEGEQFNSAYDAIYGRAEEQVPSVAKLTLTIEPLAEKVFYTATVRLLDEQKRTVAWHQFELFNRAGAYFEPGIPWRAESERVQAESWRGDDEPLTLSEPAQLVIQGDDDTDAKPTGESLARLQHQIKRPAEFEPSSLPIGEALVGSAQKSGKNLVGGGSPWWYIMRGHLELRTPRGVRDYHEHLRQSAEDGWWLLQPRYPRSEARSEIDRREAQSLMLAHDLENPPSLEDYSVFVATQGGQMSLRPAYVRFWYHFGEVALQNRAGNRAEWFEIIGNLTPQERHLLFRGEKLSLGMLPSGVRSRIAAVAQTASIAKKSAGSLVFPDAHQRLAEESLRSRGESFVTDDIGELRASGLLAQGTIQLVQRVVPGITTPAATFGNYPSVHDAHELALLELEKRTPSANQKIARARGLQEMRLCDIREFRIRVMVAPGYGFDTTLLQVENVRAPAQPGVIPSDLAAEVSRSKKILAQNPLTWPTGSGGTKVPPPTFSLGIR